jgi:hypothetical protein
MKKYVFGLLPIKLLCGGGSPKAPPPPPPPPPPPQLAKVPQAAAVRNDVAAQNIAQGRGEVTSTLLTGGLGDPIKQDKLGRKTLLGGV